MKPRSVLIRRSREGLEVSVDFLHDGGQVRKAQVQKAVRDTLREALAMLEDSSARVERGGFREGRRARTEMLLVEMEGGADVDTSFASNTRTRKSTSTKGSG